MRERFFWRVQCLFLGLVLFGCHAAACTLPDLRTNERPVPSGGGPTEILTSFIIADFLGVDDVNQQLDLDMRIKLSWTDPRLIGLEGCRIGISDIWFPRVIIFNSSKLRAARNNALNQAEIGQNGRVTYINRYVGLVSSYHDLRAFPFDAHDFKIRLGSLEESLDELVFVPDDKNSWISDRLNIEGWDVKGLAISAENLKTRESVIDISQLTLTVSAKREPDFYIFRVLLLLVFVVAMSWTIFWVPPSRFEFQIGLGATSMLTTIAFYLSIGSSLPPLGYLTTLDRMLIWSIILVFLSIVEALVAGLMVQGGTEDRAVKLDKVSRFAFPLLLFGGWAFEVVSA